MKTGRSNLSANFKKVISFRIQHIASKKTLSRVVAVLVMSALLTPAVFFVGSQGASAHSAARQSQAPPSAPPEPFLIQNVSGFGSIAPLAINIGTQISEFFSGPDIPAGLGAAKVPTVSENLTSAFGRIFAFFAASSKKPAALPPPPPGSTSFDFDGDGKADIGRWHSANTEFKVKNSNGGSYSTYTIGLSSAKAAPGDFDGDSKADAAVFNAGTWTIKKSTNGNTQTISWGASGDIPVAGDYDGDGTTDAAVFRPSTNTWWTLQSSNGANVSTSFGSSGDVVVPGNYS